jgi:hypothetical protein
MLPEGIPYRSWESRAAQRAAACLSLEMAWSSRSRVMFAKEVETFRVQGIIFTQVIMNKY